MTLFSGARGIVHHLSSQSLEPCGQFQKPSGENPELVEKEGILHRVFQEQFLNRISFEDYGKDAILGEVDGWGLKTEDTPVRY